MKTALWIITLCEVIRTIQNMVQIAAIRHDTRGRDNAYAEFVKSLKQSDKQFVKELLEELDREGAKE